MMIKVDKSSLQQITSNNLIYPTIYNLITVMIIIIIIIIIIVTIIIIITIIIIRIIIILIYLNSKIYNSAVDKKKKNPHKIRRKRILVWTIKCIQHQL